MIAIAEAEYASGTANIHMLFPAPVAILTKTSWPWRTGMIASSCPGLAEVKPNTFSITVMVDLTAGQEDPSTEQGQFWLHKGL